MFPTKQDPGTTFFRAVLPPEPEEATAREGERSHQICDWKAQHHRTRPLPVSAEWQPEVTVPVARKMNMSVKKYSAAIACSASARLWIWKECHLLRNRPSALCVGTKGMPSGTYHTGITRQTTMYCNKHSGTLRNVRMPQLSVKRALMSAWPSLDVLTTILQKCTPCYHLPACQSDAAWCLVQGVERLACCQWCLLGTAIKISNTQLNVVHRPRQLQSGVVPESVQDVQQQSFDMHEKRPTSSL